MILIFVPSPDVHIVVSGIRKIQNTPRSKRSILNEMQGITNAMNLCDLASWAGGLFHDYWGFNPQQFSSTIRDVFIV